MDGWPCRPDGSRRASLGSGDKLLGGSFLRAVLPRAPFLVQQNTDHGAEPERPVDDFTGNGTNGEACLEEAVRLTTLDEFGQLVDCVSSAFPSSGGWNGLRLAKVDMAKAYKQVPVHPEDRPNLVVGVSGPGGQISYFVHNVLPFGARAAPYHFARVAHAIISVAQGIFQLPVQNYLDDFWMVAPEEVAEEAFSIFCFIFELLGFMLKTKKAVRPTERGPLLGVEADLSGRNLRFHVDPQRRERLLTELRAVVRARRLVPGQAARLAGRLVFAASALAGRVGRAFLQPLFRLANLHRQGRAREDATDMLCLEDGELTDRLLLALEWWVALLEEAPPRWVFRPLAPPRFEGWTDAALTPWGLSGVLAGSEDLGSTRCIGCRLEGRMARRLPPAHLGRRATF